MNLRIAVLALCIALCGCMTPEQVAARQKQEAEVRAQQEAAFLQQLSSQCEELGYKQKSSKNKQCVAQKVEEMIRVQREEQAHKELQQQQDLAVISCAGRMTNAMGYFPALAACRQNSGLMPPQQPVIIAPAPAIHMPTSTRCLPIPGGGMDCRSY